MLAVFSSLLIGLSLQVWDNYEEDEKFNFYLGEFAENKFEESDSAHFYIEKRLAESMFDTNNASQFKSRLRRLQTAFRHYPDQVLRFQRLDDQLSDIFESKLQRAKRIRWLSAAGGAVVGALVAVPVGRAIGGGKALLIAVPAGALAGAGAGFLLADLLTMPDYAYDDLGAAGDLIDGLEQIDEALGGKK